MGKLGRTTALAFIISLFIAAPALARQRSIPAIDHIPLGDWTYDAMISLAADDLLPGYSARVFTGDRLFDRIQMAQVVALAIDVAKDRPITLQQTALVDKLVMEFGPELEYLYPGIVDEWNGRAVDKSAPTGTTFPMGYVRATEQHGTAEGSQVTLPFRLSIFSAISERGFGIGTMADDEDKFLETTRYSEQPDKVLLKGFTSNVTWSVGKEYQSWGPSYVGGLLLSDNSSAFWGARGSMDVDFGKLIGKFKITEAMDVFEDEGVTFYLFGRRWEKPVSKNLFWGLSETAKMSVCPNPAILVLPVYAYQHIFGGPGSALDDQMNALYGTDLTYRTESGTEYYGEFMVDDITAPSILGEHIERPSKTGYLVGVYLPKTLSGGRYSSLRAEYGSIDPETYAATRDDYPELAYTHNRMIIGSPIGPDSKSLYLRGEYYLTNKLSVSGEYLHLRQGSGFLASFYDAVNDSDAVAFSAAYDFTPDKSIALRLVPRQSNFGSELLLWDTVCQLRATFAF